MPAALITSINAQLEMEIEMRSVELNEIDFVFGGVVEGQNGEGCTDPRSTSTPPKIETTSPEK